MTSRTRILLTDEIDREGVEILTREGGFDVEVRAGLDEERLASAMPGIHGLIVRSGTRVTRNVLESAPDLRLVGRAGVGVDNVDLDTATQRGVLIVNSPEGNVVSVAEHTLALIACTARGIPLADRRLRAGRWERDERLGIEMAGLTLGLVGLGRIGSAVALRATAFGMRVLACDPYVSTDRAREAGVELMEFDTLLAASDVVSIHVPYGERTRRMFGAAQMARMRPGARLICTARGGIVDEKALAAALRTGRMAAAALDVFEREPLDAPELTQLDTLVLTPHIGGLTVQARRRIACDIARQFVDFFARGRVTHAVNAVAVADPHLAPFVDLARTLGAFAAQMAPGRVLRVAISCEGEIARADPRALCVAALCGILRHAGVPNVNPVSAEWIAKDRGIRTTESRTPESKEFRSLVTLSLETDAGLHTVSGIVVQDQYPRIVRVDGYRVEIPPAPHLLVMVSPDRPGMVGRYGTILGARGLNIDRMVVGRAERGKPALVAIALDDPVPEAVLQELAEACRPGRVVPVSL